MIITTIIVLSSFSHQFYLKHSDKNSFLCESDPSLGRAFVTMCSQDRAIDFKIEKTDTGKAFFYPVNKDLVLDATSKTQVILYKKHGGENQRFSISYIGPDKFIITNREKCVTASDDAKHYMKKCDYGPSQVYMIVHNRLEKKETTAYNSNPIYGNFLGSQFNLINKMNQLMRENNALTKNHSLYDHHGTSHGHTHHEHQPAHNVNDRTGDYIHSHDDDHHSHMTDYSHHDGHHGMHHIYKGHPSHVDINLLRVVN